MRSDRGEGVELGGGGDHVDGKGSIFCFLLLLSVVGLRFVIGIVGGEIDTRTTLQRREEGGCDAGPNPIGHPIHRFAPTAVLHPPDFDLTPLFYFLFSFLF